MLDRSSARKILDAVSHTYGGPKKASAATFSDTPFDTCADPIWWDEVADRELTLTRRTLGYLIGYGLLSGGVIPLRGLELADGYFRPDQYVIRALRSKGLISISNTPPYHFEFTQAGWSAMAEFISTGADHP